MSYKRRTWQNGEAITEEKLNNIEDGIEEAMKSGGGTGGAKEVHVRISCPPLLCGCNYLNFTASKNEMELITRRVIKELEGDSAKNLDRYMDETSKEYANMVEILRKHLGVDSLKFNTLGTIEKAIGLPKDRICTHCFDGTSWGE